MTLNDISSLIKRYRRADWVENRVQLLVVFKKCTLLTKTSKPWGEGMERGFQSSNVTGKTVGIVILIFHSIDIKSKLEEIEKLI